MSRRTKEELHSMQLVVSYYLNRNGNDPHESYNQLIKDYLMSGRAIPNYIKGIKDFISLSSRVSH